MPFDALSTVIAATLEAAPTPEKSIGQQAAELIEAGIEKIKLPKHWCKGTFSRRVDVDDRIVRQQEQVYQMCALGAVFNGGPPADAPGTLKKENPFLYALGAMNLVASDHGFDSIAALNDCLGTTHSMVISAMKKAANIARNPIYETHILHFTNIYINAVKTNQTAMIPSSDLYSTNSIESWKPKG